MFIYDQDGNVVKYSDLSPKRVTLNRSRQLSLLSLLDFGLYALGSDLDKGSLLVEKMKATRQEIIAMGYGENIRILVSITCSCIG